MKKENKYHLFWRTLFILFVIYIALFLSVENGHYERENLKKAVLTEEKIKEFENDVKNNKEVDIKDYLEQTHMDYSSPFSNFAVKLSNKVEKAMDKCINQTTKLIKKYFS